MSNTDFDIRKAQAFAVHPAVVGRLTPEQRSALKGFARSLITGGKFQVELENGRILRDFAPRRFNFPEGQVVGINGSSIYVLKFSEVTRATEA